ncbi:hypothetical protein HLB44_19580 [Aquincola sp. S2]|uniref:XRE family transcriptional regulator n=1 Tax=Pseudaquabacterium terrae TaxID=2732868 RepID=A0ABX2EKL7_9BURK|nr:hypothetical protein [Aquabacterium terrae]NRF69201.1 hypothetical protein [Aquabacterium terrae]
MLSVLLPVPVLPEHFGYRPVPAACVPAPVVDGGPLPLFGGIGTGGLESASYYLARAGYRPYEVLHPAEPAAAVAERPAPFVDLMQTVKDGFGRTMSSLPEVFGVSRQTLYNWLAGEIPKEQHHAKLQALAAAARVFQELGFKPTSSSLGRTVLHGKSLLQLIGDGANGDEVARRLVRVSQRGSEARTKLDAVLGGRKAPRLDAADMGTPSLVEDA